VQQLEVIVAGNAEQVANASLLETAKQGNHRSSFVDLRRPACAALAGIAVVHADDKRQDLILAFARAAGSHRPCAIWEGQGWRRPKPRSCARRSSGRLKAGAQNVALTDFHARDADAVDDRSRMIVLEDRSSLASSTKALENARMIKLLRGRRFRSGIRNGPLSSTSRPPRGPSH
jgi:hypothetical protein